MSAPNKLIPLLQRCEDAFTDILERSSVNPVLQSAFLQAHSRLLDDLTKALVAHELRFGAIPPHKET